MYLFFVCDVCFWCDFFSVTAHLPGNVYDRDFSHYTVIKIKDCYCFDEYCKRHVFEIA